MIKRLAIVLAILILLLTSCSQQDDYGLQDGEILPPSPPMKEDPVKTEFTMTEVGMHNIEDDCWLVIDNNVYDVTDWIPLHPGKLAILEGCGKDATGLFETRPMGSGTPHSQRARDIREDYYIGELINGR